MEASSKPESESLDIESQEVRPSMPRPDDFGEDKIEDVRSVFSIQDSHVDATAEAAFLKRMDYRMIPLLFMICK
jgi:hypothetical protein